MECSTYVGREKVLVQISVRKRKIIVKKQRVRKGKHRFGGTGGEGKSSLKTGTMYCFSCTRSFCISRCTVTTGGC